MWHIEMFVLPYRQCATLFAEDRWRLPFVFSPEYFQFHEKRLSASGVIVGYRGAIMPLCLFRGRFLKAGQLMFPPVREYGRIPAHEELEMLEVFLGYMRAQHMLDRLIVPPSFALFQTAPMGTRHCSFGTYYLDLEHKSEEILWTSLHSHHRYDIRNAQQDGVTIRAGAPELDAFYALYQTTMARSGMPCEPLSYFEDLWTALGEEHIVCAVAYDGAIPQGGLFALYTTYAAYYLYGAWADEMTIKGSIKALHWETIRFLKGKEVRRYDFAGARLSDVTGTKLDDIQRFKARFGSTLEKGFLWKGDLPSWKTWAHDYLRGLRVRFNGVTKGDEKKASVDIVDQEIHPEVRADYLNKRSSD